MLAAADPFKTDSLKYIETELERSGYAVVHDFFDATDSALLAAECRALHDAGELRPAAVGRGDARSEQAHIRGDHTRWFDPSALAPAQSTYWTRMQALRIHLNRTLLLGLDDLEAQYALYPAGTRYARHRDRFRDDDARILSSVLYLNAHWCDDEGGALRLYLGVAERNPHVDIYPESGTLLLFLSVEFDHEVLPASRERLSIAGWFRRCA
ncbi:MAG: 2OG-Fe(II) oxygenase [Rudaea sp.]|nr:2OG-Fe(II) oxygenase [Rudaea sp.]